VVVWPQTNTHTHIHTHTHTHTLIIIFTLPRYTHLSSLYPWCLAVEMINPTSKSSKRTISSHKITRCDVNLEWRRRRRRKFGIQKRGKDTIHSTHDVFSSEREREREREHVVCGVNCIFSSFLYSKLSSSSSSSFQIHIAPRNLVAGDGPFAGFGRWINHFYSKASWVKAGEMSISW
jgi:hypothetical protein